MTDIIAGIGGFLALLVTVLLALRKRDRKNLKEGQEEAEEQARRLDYENAAAIRDRVRNSERVQSDPASDTRGVRD